MIRNGLAGVLDGVTTGGTDGTSIIVMSSRIADISMSGLNSSEEGCEFSRGAALAGASSLFGEKNRLMEACRRSGRADFGFAGVI